MRRCGPAVANWDKRLSSSHGPSGPTDSPHRGPGTAHGAVGGPIAWAATLFAQQAKLLASDAAIDDRFGDAAGVDGDTAIVGSKLDDDTAFDSGSAYVYLRTGTSWAQQGKLVASDPQSNDQFGFTVAVSGDTAVVGGPFNDDVGGSTGSAYVFNRTGGSWAFSEKLLPDDPGGPAQFRYSVALDGDTMAIGARRHTANGTDAGAAYIFTRTAGSWTQQKRLLASDGAAGDRFGYFVDVDGDTAVVGAPEDADAGNQSGSAYVFDRDLGGVDEWGQRAKLTASDAAANDSLGEDVAISGDIVVVGAQNSDDAPDCVDQDCDSGSVYVFERDFGGVDAWGQRVILTASDAEAGDDFGTSVDIDGDRVAIGWRDADDATSCVDQECDSGAIYIFERNLGSTDAWGQRAKVLANEGAPGDGLGRSIAIIGLTVVDGARTDEVDGDSDDESNSGSAIVFVAPPEPAIPVPIVSPLGQLALGAVFAGLLMWRLTRRSHPHGA